MEVGALQALFRQSYLLFSAAYEHFAATYYPNTLPHIGNCAGSETAAVFGCALLTSYLGLFINFYFQTYKKPVRSQKATTNSNGVANGKANGTRYLLSFSSSININRLTPTRQPQNRLKRLLTRD